jgi:predicted aspartyl protease
MGTFYTDCTIANIANRAKAATLPKFLVDTGSEHTWVPSAVLEQLNIRREKKDLTFTMANGQRVTRTVGFAVVEVGDEYTVDEVVFGEPGDMSLLGARSLEGLNLTVDPVRKKLVAAGPLPAATPRRVPSGKKKRGKSK